MPCCAVGVGGAPSCADAAVSTLLDVMRQGAQYGGRLDGIKGEELAFQVRPQRATQAAVGNW